MTVRTNARVAGVAFLVYIAAGVLGMAGLSATLLVNVVLSLVMCFSALLLGVTLYALTRDEDRDIALLGMTFRIAEGVVGAAFMPMRLALQLAARAGTSAAPDPQATQALGEIIGSARSLNVLLSAIFFAAGSTLFCWLLLRGRMIPAALGWLGLLASILLLVGLPLQLGHLLSGGITMYMWLPMAVFEIVLAFWLILRGVAAR